jgi:hypothetical protein
MGMDARNGPGLLGMANGGDLITCSIADFGPHLPNTLIINH